MPRRLNAILFLMAFWLAIVGLGFSTLVYVRAVCAEEPPRMNELYPLVAGLFVIWAITIFSSNWLSKDFKSKDIWKATLRGCPRWMRWLAWGFFGFPFVNLLIVGPNGGVSIFMTFYAISAATMCSAANVIEADPARRCPKGHLAPDSATYCPDCGALISDGSKSED